MKYADEMGSGAMIYIPSFIKNGLGIQKLISGIHRDIQSHIHTAWRSQNTTSVFLNKESILKDINISTNFCCTNTYTKNTQ
jgi:hypothetical protein